MVIRLVVADDHKLVRQGLRSLLEKEADILVVAEAENGRQALERARDASPDVVIMDVSMPDLNGIEATRQIVAEVPGVKVIGLSMHSEPQVVAEMIKAGVSGFVLKDCAFGELASAVRRAAESKTYFSPALESQERR